jgi:hypothetical protein
MGIFENEAEEEEEEDAVKGLEDFGFGAINASVADDKQGENEDVEVRDDDFENIVDKLSDGEGDEDAFKDYAVQQVRSRAPVEWWAKRGSGLRGDRVCVVPGTGA